MRTRPVLVLILSAIFGSCQYLPFWPRGNKPSSNPDLVLLVPRDTLPYPLSFEPIAPKLKGKTLFYLRGDIAGDLLCAPELWAKKLPDGKPSKIENIGHCVNFFDLRFSDTESLLVATTGRPYEPAYLDTTTNEPSHKLLLMDWVRDRVDTLHWGCPGYIDPRFDSSGRYVFVTTAGDPLHEWCAGVLWRYDLVRDTAESLLTFAGGPRYGGWSIYTGYVLEGDSAWIVQGDPVDMNVLPDLDPWEGQFVVMQKYYGPAGVAPGGLVVWDRVGRVLYTLEVPWPSPWDFKPFSEYYPQWAEIPGLGRGIVVVKMFDPGAEGGFQGAQGIYFVKNWRNYIAQQEEVP